MNINFLDWLAVLGAAAFMWVLYYLDRKKNMDFGLRTIIAMGFGVIVGLVFKGHDQYVSAVGTIYAHAIAAVVVPLLAFSIVSSLTGMGDTHKLKKVGLKTAGFLTLNTLLASSITLVAAFYTRIGAKLASQPIAEYKKLEAPSFLDTIINLFPQNLSAHWVNNQILPLLLFFVLIAIAYNQLSAEHAEKLLPFKHFVDSGNLVMGQVINIIIFFTPYAVLSLIAHAVSKNALSDLLPLFSVLILAYILCAIQIFVVEGLLLRVIGKLNPIPFFKGMWPAGAVAFTSQSSIGTIPVTVHHLKKIGVQEDIATLGATLGANIGMPGCAGIWPVLSAVFAINLLGIDYSAMQYVFLVVLTVLVSIGTIGVPGTATITATTVFLAAGLPVEIIVLLTPISSIVDMARTATNVIGAATASTLVAKSEGLLDLERYHAAGAAKGDEPTSKPISEPALW